jgi:conjugative relaxase-like TrwC/TraI family protein
MLKPKSQLSLRSAREYFHAHLRVGDYYAQGQTIPGEWLGLGAEKLGLTGVVREQQFLALCAGLDPQTGKRLTARLNSVRREGVKIVPSRRVFYDWTLSPPKSVSVVALLQDDRILELHNRAVRSALSELEVFAETRVRRRGANGERVTGQIVAACFQHDTSRELDPHLHTHGIVFNTTYDNEEGRWKALHAVGMYRTQKFVENVYYHELAKGLSALGYEIVNNARDFEIGGVPRSVIERFSKRHRQIDEEARRVVEKGFTGNVAELREKIAHEKRRRKLGDSTAARLRGHWVGQLRPEESAALSRTCRAKAAPEKTAELRPLLDWADEHLFERRSIISDHELLSAALARGRGQVFDLRLLRAAMGGRGYVREEGTRRLTSPEVLRRELEIVVAAHDGRGRHRAFNASYAPWPALSAEQAAAVRQILASEDFITLFRGGAGTGKSHALHDVARGLASTGNPVVALAPQRQQVQGLEKDGLPARTLASVLEAQFLPPRTTVILDEAGQVGGRELHRLIGLVQGAQGRLILSGDTSQHGAVTASDALRAIERHSGLKPAEIRTIRRQDPALGASLAERRFIRSYRAAVQAAAAGRTEESFDRLDLLGCVREAPPDERRALLASEYAGAAARGELALVIAQTRDEVGKMNEAIRERLRAELRLPAGTVVTAYQALDLDRAQKRDARHYGAGQYAVFLKSYGRFAKGDLCPVAASTARGVALMKNGRRSTLSYRYTDRILLAAPQPMEVSPGDRLQLKLNGRSLEGSALANGELVTARQMTPDGGLVVVDAAGSMKTLAPSQFIFNRGYAVTSYASQGKTVDSVFFSDSASRAATSAEQWYVTISRARKRAMIFTSDKTELRANIRHLGDRELALELKPAAALPAHYVGQALPAWARRARALIERVRRHRMVTQFIARRTERHRLAE